MEFLYFFSKNIHPPPPTQLNWSKPRVGFLNINFDASFPESSNASGWGFIIRDDVGEGVAAGQGKIQYASSPFQVETAACLQAPRFAAAQGMLHLELETDCKNLRCWP
jgi:ribonuclease HI